MLSISDVWYMSVKGSLCIVHCYSTPTSFDVFIRQLMCLWETWIVGMAFVMPLNSSVCRVSVKLTDHWLAEEIGLSVFEKAVFSLAMRDRRQQQTWLCFLRDKADSFVTWAFLCCWSTVRQLRQSSLSPGGSSGEHSYSLEQSLTDQAKEQRASVFTSFSF